MLPVSQIPGIVTTEPMRLLIRFASRNDSEKGQLCFQCCAWVILLELLLAINQISLLKVHEVSTSQKLDGIVFGLDNIKHECHAPSQSRFQAKTTLPLVRSSFSVVYPKRFIFLAKSAFMLICI